MITATVAGIEGSEVNTREEIPGHYREEGQYVARAYHFHSTCALARILRPGSVVAVMHTFHRFCIRSRTLLPLAINISDEDEALCCSYTRSMMLTPLVEEISRPLPLCSPPDAVLLMPTWILHLRVHMLLYKLPSLRQMH